MRPRPASLLTLTVVALRLAACTSGSAPPVYGTLPPFTLTAQDNTPVTADHLRGRIWIANFIFTRCPDICPALTQRMREVRRALPAGSEGVHAVSISVDPDHDTPAVLQDYALRHDAAGPDWTFLTGPPETIRALIQAGFRLALSDNGSGAAGIVHSDRFVLIDRALRIRGYYRATDPAELDRLLADARRLLAMQSPG